MKDKVVSWDSHLDKKYGVYGTETRTTFQMKAQSFVLGEQIKDEREKANLTQAEMAKKTGTKKIKILNIMTYDNRSNKSFLQVIALTSVLIGTIGTLYFVLKGREHVSIILLLLFAGWDIAPFAGLLISNKMSIGWTDAVRLLLYWLMLILTIVSLSAYSGILTKPNMKQPAFIFLIVPLISWVLITVVFLVGKNSKKNLNS